MKSARPPEKAPHLSVVPITIDTQTRLSRAQVAERIGVSVPTVRRYEGSLLHPHVDAARTITFIPHCDG